MRTVRTARGVTGAMRRPGTGMLTHQPARRKFRHGGFCFFTPLHCDEKCQTLSYHLAVSHFAPGQAGQNLASTKKVSDMLDFDFSGHNTLYATHGLHPYTAKCPPQLVQYGLQHYSGCGETVLDPMVGSGTTLVEARLMGRHAIGFDIDPLARLIAQVKSRELDDESIESAYEAVVQQTTDDLNTLQSEKASPMLQKRALPPDFHNQEYWFSPSVSRVLAILSYHIAETQMSSDVHDFLWVAFSSLILAKKSVANARDIIHSRHHHYQHSSPPDVLAKFEARITRMRGQMAEFRRQCVDIPDVTTEARLGDARCLPLEDESVDLIFTSPPYGTALDYPRAHFLAVAWMQRALGITVQEYKANAPDYIGSERGCLAGNMIIDERLGQFALGKSIVQALDKRSTRHAKLLQRYFVDMHQALSEMARVLRHGRHAIIVICPSHIRKVEVPTHDVFIEMGRAMGLELKEKHTRTINSRLRLLPYMPKAFGSRMSTEFILVFQKL
jgi:DNA modification methylase